MKIYGLLFCIFLYNITDAKCSLKVLVIDQNTQLVNFLKKQQYAVEVLTLTENGSSNETLSLPQWNDVPSQSWCSTTCSYAFRIYRFLKDKNYDAIFFPEQHGYGYYLTEAKKQGYGFAKTILIGYVSEPTEWLWDISNITAPYIESHAKVEMEQKSIEQADIAIIPSNFAYKLLKNKGWKFPKNTKILPPLYEKIQDERASDSMTYKKERFNEIVFIGPCHFRKGYDLFIETIKKAYAIDPQSMNKIKITILNKDTSEDLEKTSEDLPNINYVIERNYANYIKNPRRIVLFTSREELGSYDKYTALHEGAYLIGFQDGFLEEIIQNTNLLSPASNTSILAEKLIYTLDHPEVPIPKKSLKLASQKWKSLLTDLRPKIHTSQQKLKSPFVSVCITHFNRPDQLIEALKSFDKQTYKNFEVLVMDDGSKPEVVKHLKEKIEPFMKIRNWKIFYQKNQFISNARNNLVTHAKGPLILLFEDDDLALTDTIERFVKIQQRTHADIVNTHGGVARENKCQISELWLAAGSYVSSISGKNQMGSSAIALMTKKTFQKLAGYFDSYGFTYSDMEFYIRAALNNLKIVTSVEPTYIYNFVGNNHLGLEGLRHHSYQTRIVLNAYRYALPKEFRNVPFRLFSLEQELEDQRNTLIYDTPLWKIIYLRFQKLWYGFTKSD